MRLAEPPFVARWILEHRMPGERDQALAGDLLEEFRSGRTALWFWRQVLSAVFLRCWRELLIHRSAMLFAVLWSMLTPAWLVAVADLEARSKLSERLSGMDWPWSTIVDPGLLLATNLIFIWAGILVYLLPDLWAAGNLRVRTLGRGILLSLPALVVAWAALIVLPKGFLAVRAADRQFAASATRPMTPVEAMRLSQQAVRAARLGEQAPRIAYEDNDSRRGREPGPRHAITDTRAVAMLVRLPFFLVIVFTLWGAAPLAGKGSKGVAA
ncbi:MAG: hypothetical protein WBE72_15760 [Terracidiphilus sp.]